jgi:hypothetical protein
MKCIYYEMSHYEMMAMKSVTMKPYTALLRIFGKKNIKESLCFLNKHKHYSPNKSIMLILL